MIKSLFISKHLSEIQPLSAFAVKQGISVKAFSHLSFEQVPFQLPAAFDVIFFSSPRAVTFYQSQHSIPQNVALASAGGKTTTVLERMGYSVDFNGDGKGSISEVAQAFQSWLGSRVALFPVSTLSLGTFSQGLTPRQASIATCYATKIKGTKLHWTFDAYVFTSPSNVDGFFIENTLPSEAYLIAWGESTAKALKKRTNATIHTLNAPTLDALIEYLKSV